MAPADLWHPSRLEFDSRWRDFTLTEDEKPKISEIAHDNMLAVRDIMLNALTLVKEAKGGDEVAEDKVPGDYPDPGANKIGDHFYLVATGGGPKGRESFRILRSPNLLHWEPCGQALRGVFGPDTLPSWSGGAHGQSCDYWAPEIHQLPGCVAVFFSAREPKEVGRALHIGVATAERPEGPYRDIGQPLISDPHWAIDASYFHDVATGKQYVLWKVDGNAHKVPSCIKIRELDAAGTGLAKSEAVALIHSELKWEGGMALGEVARNYREYPLVN
eukprot:s71_g27.t1